MCGIAGFIDTTPQRPFEVMEAIARQMADALTHRGPDEGTVWVKAQRGVALGHRRLAIQDVSPLGAQPMVSACGRLIIVYNGELYNTAELASAIDYSPRGHSDTEILLQHIAQHGVAATLPKLNGIFAFALYDIAEHTLTLARDHLGIKPLYYGFLGQSFAFASELKALKAHPQFVGTLNMNAAQHMLQHGAVHAPDSIYENIHQLPAGMWGVWQGGQFTTRTYYSIADVAARGQANPFSGTLADATAVLHTKLQAAVSAQMISDVPLGAFLSGGVDSSLVVALMQAHSATPVQTFSIGFAEGGYNEAPHAAAVAKHLGTQHTELQVSMRQAQDVIPQLATIYDEPFADSSQIPTFLVSQLARQHVTVALSGDGGDEGFGGYVRHDALARMWRYLSPIPAPLRRAVQAALLSVPAPVWHAVGQMIPASKRPTHFADKLHKAARLLGARSLMEMYGNLVQMWGDGVLQCHPERSEGSPADRTLSKGDPSAMPQDNTLSSSATLRLADFQTYLPDDILTKVDRASMAVSLEARVPLLDKNIVEFAWSLPDALLIQNGVGKLPLRGVLSHYVPDSLINRPKQGFSVPVEHWLRTDLRDWAEDLLSEQALQSLPYNVAAIRTRWQQHLAGTHIWHHSLWHVLMLQAWLREDRKFHPI